MQISVSFSGCPRLPLSYLIDPEGRIIGRYQGEPDLKQLESRIRSLLPVLSGAARARPGICPYGTRMKPENRVNSLIFVVGGTGIEPVTLRVKASCASTVVHSSPCGNSCKNRHLVMLV